MPHVFIFVTVVIHLVVDGTSKGEVERFKRGKKGTN